MTSCVDGLFMGLSAVCVSLEKGLLEAFVHLNFCVFVVSVCLYSES